MSEAADVDIEALHRQLADLALPGGEAASEVLLRLAEAIFPGRVGFGDPARMLWPEARQRRRSRLAGDEDIDARGQLEARIEESEVRFQALIEQLPAVVFFAALGERENEVYVSPQVEALLGFSQEEWLNDPMLWYTQLHPDDHPVVIEAFTRGVQTGEPFQAEVRFMSRAGAEVWIRGEARLVLDPAGRPAYFQGVAFDVTPSKRAQEALAEAERFKLDAVHLQAEVISARNVELTQLNRQLSEARDQAEAAARERSAFLTTMSHELRTPLNSVIVLAGLLADSQLSRSQRDMVRQMRLASDHLLELINDVLEFSRLRAGHVELNRQAFDLQSLIADTLDIVAVRADEKGLELRHGIAADVPRTIMTDEGRLRQVLLNLLGNAVKFTAAGYVEVDVTGRPLGSGRWEFQCSVHDTGVGIGPETAATLFDEFRQADSGIAREFGGSGLGLTICKQLCDLLGGRIWVDTRDGPGATVRFTWVADAAQATEARRPDGRDGRPPTDAANVDGDGTPPAAPATLRILLVDDDLMNRRVAELLLAAMGHRADVVASGSEAVDAVIRQEYDTVLMDVAMPIMDGLSATRAIRRLGTEIHQPYIVALTANALPGDAEASIEAGMDAYVAKPIKRLELARALASSTPGPCPDQGPDGMAFDPSMPRRILEQFGPEPLRQLLALFRDQAHRMVRTASDAVAAGDADQAAGAAHTLKSSAATVGAIGLASLCADLETGARTGAVGDAGPIAAALHPSLAGALEQLAALEASLEPGG